MATVESSVCIVLERRRFRVGEKIRVEATGKEDDRYEWSAFAVSTPPDGEIPETFEDRHARVTTLDTAALGSGVYEIRVRRTSKTESGGEVQTTSEVVITVEDRVARARPRAVGRTNEAGVDVNLRQVTQTSDQALWVRMRDCLDRRSFASYRDFVDKVLCGQSYAADCHKPLQRVAGDCHYAHGVHGYALLKAATEIWLLCYACCGDVPECERVGESLECHVDGHEFDGFDPAAEYPRLGYETDAADMRAKLKSYLESSATGGTLPYIGQILENLDLGHLGSAGFPCVDSIRREPCLFELLWSYWQEEGMLVQTLNAITLRFQNRRVRSGSRDALSNLEINPLRPLNNLLWGYIQDEDRRLSVRRRAYEYEHQYGLRLIGKAVGELEVAERRSKFLEAFHALLNRAALYYRDSQNLLVKPDGFPLLESIRAVHLLLAEGAHNQWGDLPSTARAEMLIQQWLLTQPPMREFLQTRAMVPYDEPWMGPVDAMKKIMGWTDVTVIHFHKLATYGERILLSVRFGHWNAVDVIAEQAENWVKYWKAEIQGYIESYRAATGVDLGAPLEGGKQVDATQPAVLMQRRLQGLRGAAE